MDNCRLRVTALMLVAALAACGKSDPPASAAPAPSPHGNAFAVQAPPPPPPDAPSKLDMLLASSTLADAITVAKPDMTDTDDETSPGAVEVAVWAAAHMHWTDVSVARNESSFALIRKDTDAARGKRMCVRGSIIQIRKEALGSASVFTGLMLSGYTEIASFIAAGSTGDLVQQSDARICGVVIGTYDYSNSAGGKGHAVSLVGMFDLPENRKVAP